mmetsp:Transcript_43991/g.88758  ORF Transcript_43991/g.88758 Transcript_43991/m.88758 type:complete len:401 (-) Transcript_43991:80-1282(-)
MVAASKVAAQGGQPWPAEPVDGEAHELAPLDEVGRESSTAGSSDVVYVPLSFGEQLVLETYVRCRQRPYDRKRQEELAAPRRRAATAGGSGEPGAASQDSSVQQPPPAKTLPRSQVDEICARLSQPRRFVSGKTSAGEEVQQSSDAERAKRAALDVGAMLERLATPRLPRAHSPTSGEKIVMSYKETSSGRSVDHERVAALAKPTKRGASCTSWGVRPDWSRTDRTASVGRGASSRGVTPRSEHTPRSERTQRPGSASLDATVAPAAPVAAGSSSRSTPGEADPAPRSAAGESGACESPGGRCSLGDTNPAAELGVSGGNFGSTGNVTPDFTPLPQAQRPSSFARHGTPGWARGGGGASSPRHQEGGFPGLGTPRRGGSMQDVDGMHQVEGRRSGVDRRA